MLVWVLGSSELGAVINGVGVVRSAWCVQHNRRKTCGV